MRATSGHPADWTWRAVGELTRAAERAVPTDPDEEYTELTLHQLGGGLSERRRVRGAQLTFDKMQLLEEGDLVTSIHAFYKGSVALVPEHLAGCAMSPNFLVFTVDQDLVDATYLTAYLSSPHVARFLEGQAKGTATRFTSRKTILSVEVPLPPTLAEQGELAGRIAERRERVAAMRQEVARLLTEVDDLNVAWHREALREVGEGAD